MSHKSPNYCLAKIELVYLHVIGNKNLICINCKTQTFFRKSVMLYSNNRIHVHVYCIHDCSLSVCDCSHIV